MSKEPITPPVWRLIIEADHSITLVWVHGSRAENLDLGVKEDVMEKMADFLAQQDFGE